MNSIKSFICKNKGNVVAFGVFFGIAVIATLRYPLLPHPLTKRVTQPESLGWVTLFSVNQLLRDDKNKRSPGFTTRRQNSNNYTP
jgi:hypothetical protein